MNLKIPGSAAVLSERRDIAAPMFLATIMRYPESKMSNPRRVFIISEYLPIAANENQA
jgi:hypothetical protein